MLMSLTVACQPRENSSLDSIVAPFLGPNFGGVAVAVVRDGEVVAKQGFGPADKERNIAVSPDTVFDLASLSKQFTGMALLVLVERGQISMDDDVRMYVPELPLFDAQRPIRIVDLSQHRSGLSEFPRAQGIPTETEILEWLSKQSDLEFATGTQWDYTNLNYFILARVVERISGQTLSDFLANEIFSPAGMRSAQVLDQVDGEIVNRAIGYCFGSPCRADDGLTGPGGVFASLEDMINWDQALSSDTLVSLEGIVGAAEVGYGLGWRMIRRGRHTLIEHDGDAIGTRTYFVRYLDVPLSIIILSNQTRFEVEKLEREIAARFISGDA
jgi:CubicO group peptidase (beta-lactamase class C family)